MSDFRSQEAGSTNTRAFTLVARADGSPIVSGTVNWYAKNISGANAGKWWRDSDQTWQVAETANAMTHQADGHWTRALAATPWIDGDLNLEYAKESTNLHVPVSRTLKVEYTPTADSNRRVDLSKILGATITGTAANIVAAFTKFFDKASPTGTVNSLPDAVAGASSGLALVGSNVGQASSVSGAVGSVTGAVGSVTGNVGGNVSGNVGGNVSGSVGSVTGAVGSVTGAVGSVTGNVGGSAASVAGAVGSVSGNVGGDVAGKVLGGGGSSISGDGVRASSVTGAVGSVTGAVGSVTGAVTLTSGERNSIAAALLDLANGVETSLTMRQTLQLVAAALAGQLSGAATTTVVIKAAGNSGTTRITATCDSSGDRSSVTLNV